MNALGPAWLSSSWCLFPIVERYWCSASSAMRFELQKFKWSYASSKYWPLIARSSGSGGTTMRYNQHGRRRRNARQMYPVKKAWRIQNARDSNMFPRRPRVRVKPVQGKVSGHAPAGLYVMCFVKVVIHGTSANTQQYSASPKRHKAIGMLA